MIMKSIREQQLIKLLKIHYGIDAQTVKPLLGGADMNASVYKIDEKSISYFVKLKYDYHDEISLSIISLLLDSSIKEIIFPVYTLNEKLSVQLNEFKIIAYPFIHAQNGFNQNLTKKQWVQLGQTLRRIHEIQVPSELQQRLRKETYSNKWREIVKSFFNKTEPQPADDKITLNFKLFFKQNIDKIYRLVRIAEELAEKIQIDVNKYVLCHADIHAGNILIPSDDTIYIIDWDEPMMASKERDLMFIGGGVGNVWNKPEEIDYFYEGYGHTNIDRTILSYYRHERIIEDIALYGQDLLSCEQDNQSRLEMFKHFKAMFDINGVVEIAFNTNY